MTVTNDFKFREERLHEAIRSLIAVQKSLPKDNMDDIRYITEIGVIIEEIEGVHTRMKYHHIYGSGDDDRK